MPRTLLGIAVLLAALANAAGAQSIERQMDEAFRLLQVGDHEAATERFNELRVDAPDNAYIDYGLACALYAKALADYSENNREMAEVGMEAAKKRFNELAESELPGLRRDAQLNAANSAALISRDIAREYLEKHPVVRPDDYSAAEQIGSEAVAAYEQFLARYPGHATATRNLDHARYVLKQVQQKRPPEEEQPESSEDEEGDESDEQEQNESGEPGDEQSENEDDAQEDADNGEQQDEAEGEQGETDQSGAGAESQADMEQNPLSRQNIEAILQSLEDVDREEQEELLKAQGAPKVRSGEWW